LPGVIVLLSNRPVLAGEVTCLRPTSLQVTKTASVTNEFFVEGTIYITNTGRKSGRSAREV
jgi:hypothetical protein